MMFQAFLDGGSWALRTPDQLIKSLTNKLLITQQKSTKHD